MGLRLHVAKKYDIQWDYHGFFNYKVDKFLEVLSALDTGHWGNPYESDMEIHKDDWKDAIEKLKDYDNLDDEVKEKLDSAIKELGYSLEDLIEIMESYQKYADPDIDYLYFTEL